MATTLVQKREEMATKSAALHALWQEAGPDRDMALIKSLEGDSAAKVAELKRRMDEINALGAEVEQLQANDDMAQKAAGLNDHYNKPAGRPVFPGAPAGDGKGREQAEQKSLGDLFVESDAFRGYQKAMRQGPAVEVKMPGGPFESKTVLTETGFAPQAVRIQTIVPGALERPRVAALIPQGRTDQVAIVYMEETTTTNAAAGVTEGNAKPESAIAFTERTSPVRKIATVLPLTDELMADVPAMRSYVEARMRLFLALAEDSALLNGSGVAPAITGLLNVAGVQTQAKGADPTPDTIYKAMVKIQTVAFLEPSGTIWNPLDWQDVRLLRTADGLYIWGSPMDQGPERIWGLPVVTTTAMTQNTALVGAFDTATQMFRREDVTFAVSSEHSDFFIRNQLMLRVEERFALVVYRPSGLCLATGV